MRIISGRLGGRNFDAPKGHKTHPMSEKARGALFSMLGDIQGLTVLDAFAGSGAMGLEAISRGAQMGLAIDSDKTAASIISSNAKALGVGKDLKVIRASVSGWSDNNPDKTFDIVIADPPYQDLQLTTLNRLPQHLVSNGLLVLSWPGHKQPLEFTGLERLVERNYGDSQLVFYRKTP